MACFANRCDDGEELPEVEQNSLQAGATTCWVKFNSDKETLLQQIQTLTVQESVKAS